MSNKINSADTNQCCVCMKTLSNKKIIECNDCSETFCKDHIKVDDTSHVATCTDCFKKKIYLDVSSEMETQVLDAKAQLSTLKEKVKTCKKHLKDKKATIERLDGQVKINEKKYARKFENLEKKIEEESKRSESVFHATESMKIALRDCNMNENSTREKLEKIQIDYNMAQTELDTLKQENYRSKSSIQDSTSKMKNCVPYSRLRNALCNQCKYKIKSNFKDEIVLGNQGKESLIASVLANREKISVRKSMSTQIVSQHEKADESCKCIIT